MQKLTQIITKAKRRGAGDAFLLNIMREYLQILILKAIYQSKYGKSLSFLGGTCLRICHDLKRFSEDLYFALDRKFPGYSFSELNSIIASFLKNTDFEVDLNISEDKIVQKSFVRVSKVLHTFGLSPLASQKIQVKLEVDTRPVQVNNSEIETFFTAKFDEMFPLLKHTDETMFAGKICAVLNRGYTKGRDFYDLLWYLNHKKSINLHYLNKSFRQAGLKTRFSDSAAVMDALKEKIQSVDTSEILKDIGRFLEDPSEAVILENYQSAFDGAVNRYVGSA